MGPSVLIPFGLVYLHMTLAPAVAAPGTVPQRDRYLPVAGVSFGLLFVTAARGILTAETRQRELYAREVAYYRGLRRALGIAQCVDKSRMDDSEATTEEVVRKNMALMLERDRLGSGSARSAGTSGWRGPRVSVSSRSRGTRAAPPEPPSSDTAEKQGKRRGAPRSVSRGAIFGALITPGVDVVYSAS